jgi:hypothetical protein
MARARRGRNNSVAQVTNMENDENDENDDRSDWLRARAKELYCRDGEIEVDSNAIISFGDDDGAYVAAWVWVPFGGEEN